MLSISNIKLSINENEKSLIGKAAKILNADANDISDFAIIKKSLDARKKNDIHYNYKVAFKIDDEDRFLDCEKNITRFIAKEYSVKPASSEFRPVVVGFGPAGMFCALVLARSGLKPIVLERGENVDDRIKTVNSFFDGGKLNTESNVQFGEGGAGTFSDGKLNTLIRNDRIDFVLKTFTKHGAPDCILYDSKPHIGTDILPIVVKNIRNEIISLEGNILFNSKFTEFRRRNDFLDIYYENDGEVNSLKTDSLVLALGHSSRDTIEKLYNDGIEMRQKSFSMGVRIEHLQKKINSAQYGKAILPAADYKLSASFEDGSSAYTFCMCPGGFVVAAASEEGAIATNGMSCFKRDSSNANSAVLVTTTTDMFPDSHPLSGMRWQRSIEKTAYEVTGSYKAPAQTVGSFLKSKKNIPNSVKPTYRPGVCFTDLHKVLPKVITDTLEKAIPAFARKLKGFDDDDAIITAPETRSSSPVRIPRGDDFQSNIAGVYPCGEGAGYSGGIMSSAVDGIKVAEAIINKYNGEKAY